MAPRVSFLLLSSFLLLLLLLLPNKIQSKPSGQPFKFLHHLEGCHKGQDLKGVHQLKRYLEKFGYLNYPPGNKSLTHADDDEFDELLESAVKTYQLNYHLKVTGSLDSKTVQQMMMPRCGIPDIINGTTSMRSGKKNHHHHHGPSSLHTVSHYTFFPNNPRWPPSKTHLTYRFRSSVSVVGLQQLRSICSRAFSRWQQVSHFTFEEVQNGAASDIVIGFHRGDHGDGYSFDGRGGTLAHAFAPTVGRFHYDADESWSTNPQPGMFDLESVAVHEIGHLLGLGHSSVPEAIMYPSIPDGAVKRNLHGDDVQGIRALYGLSK
ncbi:PREDICTED: metalloendoproteinase 2-MMP-like [Nelumbo nucifera]|uniref:Peptidase metallopeptidase domain-containing protein n=2 Tax=Nelumbo nucifera TaxID=4432 RepID=A0A822YUU6_NELNU|nr:PREDICTED: metalloendoproteinase 2-MMP-like [Nelumbo nucifera]DAD36452.1 TPA_asm: hypothetical protein HUJ06_007093 [Nelumbo nucifera]